MIVPYFDYKKLYLRDRKNINKIISHVASKGAFILQKEVKIFEDLVKEYTGSKYVIAVANGTDAMQLFLTASGIQDGDEVILSSHTMIATASAVKFCGAKPVPVDINLKDGLINSHSIENFVTKKTKAVIVTHLNGRTCDMGEIIKICKKYKLKLFEDAAQGLGSKYQNQMAGTFGLASSISLYPAKILGCLGDGGLVLTSDKKIAKKIYLLRDHGRRKNQILIWGYNSRLDNIQAAILIYFFKRFKSVIEYRRKLSQIYNSYLNNIDDIQLPPSVESGMQTGNFDTYQNYEGQFEKRDQLKQYLQKNSIGTLIPWSGIAINNLPKLGIKYRLKNSDVMFKKFLMLPMNHFLSENQVEYVAKKIRNFYK